MYSYLSSKYLITLFILFAIHSVTSETNHQSDPVHLDVYYESLCPDCSGFIERQLYPTWKLLGNMAGIFTVALYPYGNTHETRLSNNSFSYQCQHGENECRGNMLEGCLIKRCHFDSKCYMPVIACIEDGVIQKQPIETAVKECVRFFKPGKSYQWIKECANGAEGQRLIHKMAVRTGSLVPKHTWVPWLVFDGVFSQENQERAQRNLPGLVCDLYKGPTKPWQCLTNEVFH